jgi:hypothetical protein
MKKKMVARNTPRYIKLPQLLQKKFVIVLPVSIVELCA